MKKNHLKRNMSNIVTGFFVILIACLCVKYELVNSYGIDRSFHVDILTINSIFAGFLFTSLGIMTGFSSKEIIINLDKNGYMDKYYNSIYTGLFFHIISIIFAALGIVYPFVDNLNWFLIVEQLSLIGGIIYFMKSCYSIQRIIRRVRENL